MLRTNVCLPCQVVEEPAEADFILAHGTEAVMQRNGVPRDQSIEQLTELLQRCAEHGGLPLVVANPDLVSCPHL